MRSETLLVPAFALLAALAVPAAGDHANDSDDFIKFYYEDIYRPLFQKKESSDGAAVYSAETGAASLGCEFPADKQPGEFRLFIVGESVGLRFFQFAACPPRRGSGMEAAWEALLPGRRVQTISASVASYDSARLLLRVREVLDYEPDLVVVLSGNNEDPDPAKDPSMLKRFLARRVSRSEALRLFREHVAATRVTRRTRSASEMLERYRENLAEMARAAAKRKVPLVFCALPWNLVSPPDNTLPLWNEAFWRAWTALEEGDAERAEQLFSKCLAANPGSAFARYARALALRRLGRGGEAAADFREAAELTTHRVRPSMNCALREVAAKEGAAVADFEKALAEAAPDGVPDSSMFDDDVHWHSWLNPRLNAAVLRAFYEARERWPRESVAELSWSGEALEKEERQARAHGASARDTADQARRALLNGIWIWDTDPQRVDEYSVAAFELVRRWNPKALKRLNRKEPTQDVAAEIANNWWTRSRADRLVSTWPHVLDDLGETYRRAGLLDEAARAFRLSLEIAPTRALTRLRLALTERARGRHGAAHKEYLVAAEHAELFPEIGYHGREHFAVKTE